VLKGRNGAPRWQDGALRGRKGARKGRFRKIVSLLYKVFCKVYAYTQLLCIKPPKDIHLHKIFLVKVAAIGSVYLLKIKTGASSSVQPNHDVVHLC
jgi:hypothetical protein